MSIKRTRTVAIDRDWSTYRKGDLFEVVEEIDCGEFIAGDGSVRRPKNLRVVFPGENREDKFHHRTIPAEYAVDMPRVGQFYRLYANQGMRDGTVLAIIGTEFLIEYEMPAGRTFGRIMDATCPYWYRAVPMHKLPKKWQRAMDDSAGEPLPTLPTPQP